MGAEELGISVNEDIKANESFGKFDKQLKGIGGTLHLTKKDDIEKIGSIAWQLSESTGLPVVVVVRAVK